MSEDTEHTVVCKKSWSVEGSQSHHNQRDEEQRE